MSAGSIALPSANVMLPKENESTGNGSEHFLRFHIFCRDYPQKKKQGMNES
jgi:hypothetical protein